MAKKKIQKKEQNKKVTKSKLDGLKEMVNFKNSNIPWMIYGILFGPIELIIIYFGVNTDGANGLFKLIGAMLVISFMFTFIPQMLRLILKILKKDFYNEDAMASANACASGSVIITWLIILIFFSDLNGGKIGLVITIIVLMVGIMGCNIPAIWSIYKFLYLGNDSYTENRYSSYNSSSSSNSNYSGNSNSSTKKDDFSLDNLFGDEKKNVKIGKTRGDGKGFFYNEDGSLGGTSMKDKYGRTYFNDSKGEAFGTAITDSNGITFYSDKNGKVTGTSITDSNGRTYYRDTDGNVVGTSVTDSNGTTYFDDTKW